MGFIYRLKSKFNKLEYYKKDERRLAEELIYDALNNQDTSGEWFYTTAVIDTVYQLGIITLNERAEYRELAHNKEKENKTKREEKKRYK